MSEPSVPSFYKQVMSKLLRFEECANDFEAGGIDIGRRWLDILTDLGLLIRVQISPAVWQISEAGECAITSSPKLIGFISETDVSFLSQRKLQLGAWRLNLATNANDVQNIGLFVFQRNTEGPSHDHQPND